MSTKAKIILALVIVSIIVGVSIFIYKKKKAKAAQETPGKAIKSAGETSTTSQVKAAAQAALKPEVGAIDFANA